MTAAPENDRDWTSVIAALEVVHESFPIMETESAFEMRYAV